MRLMKEIYDNYKLKKIIRIENVNIYLLNLNKKVRFKNLKTLDLTAISPNISINEINTHGSVNTIKITNNSSDNILLFSGDIIKGAKQNRAIIENIIVPKNSSLDIPVTCVEKNRWHYKKRPSFTYSNFKVSPKIRNKKDYLMQTESINRIQNEVWSDIDHLSKKLNISNFSSDYTDLVNNKKIDSNIKEDINNIHFNAFVIEGVGRPFIEYYFNEEEARKNLLASIPSYLIEQDNINLDKVNFLDITVLKHSEWSPVKNIGIEKNFISRDYGFGKSCFLNDKLVHLYFYFNKQGVK